MDRTVGYGNQTETGRSVRTRQEDDPTHLLFVEQDALLMSGKIETLCTTTLGMCGIDSHSFRGIFRILDLAPERSSVLNATPCGDSGLREGPGPNGGG